MSAFRLFLNQIQNTDNSLSLDKETSNYLTQVLRIKENDEGELIFINHSVLHIRVQTITKTSLVYTLIERHPLPAPQLPTITLAQALPKNVEFGDVIKKCTELGVHTFIPLLTDRTISRPKPKDYEKKMQRWQQILEGAARQSQQYAIPELKTIQPLETFSQTYAQSTIALKLVCWEEESSTRLKDILEVHPNLSSALIVIGPEGGFTELEIDTLRLAGFESVSLGATILRTENAGFFAAGCLKYQYNL